MDTDNTNIPTVETAPAAPATNRSPLGWFAAGAIIGAIVAVGAMTVINAAQTPGRAAKAVLVDEVPTSARTKSAAAVATDENVDPNAMALNDDKPFAPKVLARPENTQGVTDAPVMIIEYSDFNCGFCRRFHSDTLQKVLDTYVATGKARFSYKHYPFLAATSSVKAVASECAAEQGKFWPYHEALFGGSVDGITDDASLRDALGRLAGDLKLDTKAFQTCMTNGAANERVQADYTEGQQLGVTGTPSFLINGKALVGAQPFEAFKQAIDEALAKK